MEEHSEGKKQSHRQELVSWLLKKEEKGGDTPSGLAFQTCHQKDRGHKFEV